MSRFHKIAGATAALLAGVSSVTTAGSASAQATSAIVVGNTDIAGALASHAGAGYKAGSVFQAAQTGTYTTWEAYAVGGTQAETYTPAVYATANGKATSLLATGTPVVIAAHQAAGWVTSSIKVNLNAGSSYWIGFLPGAASAQAGIYYEPGASAGQWNKNSNISTPDSWFSPVNSSDQRWDVALTMPGTQAPSPTTTPPTTTAPSGPVSVGVTAVGSTSSQAGAGFVWGDVVDSGTSGAGVVSAFRAYVRGGSQAQVLTPVIYGVGGDGAPSGLLAKGSPVTVAAGQAAGWVSSPISVTFAPNTKYFLGLLSGGASAEAYEYASASGGSGYWTANAGGWSNPDQTFGTKHASSQSWSFNVVVTPSGSTSGASQSSGSASGSANVIPPPTTTTTTPPTTTTTAPQSTTTGGCSSVQYSLNWCGWTQKVSDTFANDGGQLNPNLWWAPYNCSTVGCGNDGVGVRSASLLNVSNGALNIGSETLVSPKVGAGTMMGRNWLYGKFEVTASVDAGSGTGPAILLMTTGTWPQGGELDLMESPAGARSYFTVTDHYGTNNSTSGTGVSCNCTGKNTWDLIWEPGQVTEYFNGTEVWSTTNPAMIPTGTMNLAVQMDPGPNGFIAGVDGTTKSLEDLHVYSTAVWQ